MTCANVTYEGIADWWAQGVNDWDTCAGCSARFGFEPPFTVRDPDGDGLAACSERCRQRVYKRIQRGGRTSHDHQTCRNCGVSIASMRSGAKFCSTRCRVAAHRASTT